MAVTECIVFVSVQDIFLWQNKLQVAITGLANYVNYHFWIITLTFPSQQDEHSCAFSTRIYCSKLNGKWSINSISAKYFAFMMIFQTKYLGENTAGEISLFNINRFLSQCQFCQISQKEREKDCEAGRQTQHSTASRIQQNKYISQFPPLHLLLRFLCFSKGLI